MEAKEKFEKRIRAKFTTMIDWLLNNNERDHIIEKTVDVYVVPLRRRLAQHFDRLEETKKTTLNHIKSKEKEIKKTAQIKFHDQQMKRSAKKTKDVRMQLINDINEYIGLRLNPLFEIIENEMNPRA